MTPHRYWFPKTNPQQRPAGWWYVGWVLYANLSTLARAFGLFGGGALALFAAGRWFSLPALVWAAGMVAGCGALLLLNCVIGLTLVYGAPARGYLRRLLRLGEVSAPLQVADLHIGTYRVSALLGDLLPGAEIVSVDLWDNERYETERALVMLRALETPPTGLPRVRVDRAVGGAVPLPDASCDAVVLGLGIHEIPAGEERRAIFAEARRILKPGGRCLVFEHAVDLQSLLVFGFDIAHWARRSEWLGLLRETFGAAVRHQRSAAAVDLFSATKPDAA